MAVQASTAGSFRDLPRLQRNAVRMVAREAWIECECNAKEAIDLAVERIPRHVGRAYLPIGNSLAAQLIRYWSTEGVTEPEAIGVAPEPGWEVDQ